jgi:superfamily I DNA/RNA helicase
VSTLLAEIEAQQIPADTLAERGVRGEAVRLLTAHRSKGSRWDVVVVAASRRGVWPDLAASLDAAEAERLDTGGAACADRPRRCWPTSAGCSTSR